eukprot:2713521-Pleurochrysis_carterae.AAC.1
MKEARVPLHAQNSSRKIQTCVACEGGVCAEARLLSSAFRFPNRDGTPTCPHTVTKYKFVAIPQKPAVPLMLAPVLCQRHCAVLFFKPSTRKRATPLKAVNSRCTNKTG